MNPSWPPNPRDAKHRRPVLTWQVVPVTLLLIAVCFVVAFRTQLNSHLENEDCMYFQSQATRMELWNQMDTLLEKSQALEDAGASGDSAAFMELAAQIQDLNGRIESQGVLSDVKAGQVWRLFTPMFLHFSGLHILFNVYWLWSLGSVLEIRYRSWRFLLLVLSVSLVSNLAQALISGSNFGGMSGVNYGLFGFLFIHSRYHPAPSFALDKQTVFVMLGWLVVCFTGALVAVANWAHLFGFLAGAGAGFGNAALGGGVRHLKRCGEFKRHISVARASALHHCAVCGATEHEDAYLDFRVGSDGQEYCEKHLPKEGS